MWWWVFLCILSCANTQVVYVDSSSTCTSECGGSPSTALPSLSDGLSAASSSSYIGVPTVYLAAGVYAGGISINRNVIIKSTVGPSRAIIDCGGIPYVRGFTVYKSLTLIGVTIQNCSYSDGGGMGIIQNGHVELISVHFRNNVALTGHGGALQADGQASDRPILLVENCDFTNNRAAMGGPAIYITFGLSLILSSTTFNCNWLGSSGNSNADIFITANAEMIVHGTPQPMGVDCELGEATALATLAPLCGSVGVCAVDETCGNGVCDYESAESCLNCPTDCNSCLFDGFKVERYKCGPYDLSDACFHDATIISSPGVPSGSFDSYFPYAGRIFAYFQVPQEGTYTFRLAGAYSGARLIINGKLYVDAYFQQQVIDSTVKVPLKKGNVNTFEVQYLSFADLALGPYVYVQQGAPGSTTLTTFTNGYYTIGNVTSNYTRQFYKDVPTSVNEITSPGTCGDNVCQEAQPERCIYDCYDAITPDCPFQAAPPLVTGPYKFQDTIGDLVKNQYLYRFPGLEAISHGVDIVTGEPLTTPLFSFSFCDNTSLGTVQDSFHQLTYTVPPEVSAQMATQCSFRAEANKYTHSSAISTELQESSSLKVSISAAANYKSVSGTISGAFSQDKSVEAARSLESTKEGSLIVTEVMCQISKVQISNYNFHPQFVRAVANATSVDQMFLVIQKFGSHYYKSAVLGGKLKQVSLVDHSASESMGSYAVKQAAQIQFAAAVSTPTFGFSGDFAGSIDSDATFESVAEFTMASSSTSVLTYGGPPGAYSPASDHGATTFGLWARGVGALPVPIDYELDAIGNIIPIAWTTPAGKPYRDIWAQAEVLYYDTLPKPADIWNYNDAYTLEWRFPFDSYSGVTLPLDTELFTTLQLKSTGRQPCAALLMDNKGVDGTYAPALWDAQQASGSYRTFTFNCSRFEKINYLSAVLKPPPHTQASRAAPHPTFFPDPDPTDPPTNADVVLHATSMNLYDFNQSRVYPFTFSSGDGVAAPLVMVPSYLSTDRLFLRFTVKCTSSTCQTAPQFLDDHTPTTEEYDSVLVTVKGTLNEISFNTRMESWPTNNAGSKRIQITVPYDGRFIGVARSITFQAYTSRALNSVVSSRNYNFDISEAAVTITFCPDGVTQTLECAKNHLDGFTRIYSSSVKGSLKRYKSQGNAPPVFLILESKIPASYITGQNADIYQNL